MEIRGENNFQELIEDIERLTTQISALQSALKDVHTFNKCLNQKDVDQITSALDQIIKCVTERRLYIHTIVFGAVNQSFDKFDS